MTIAQLSKRIHPLVAVAAASVTLFSMVGIAAITGVLPTSHSEPTAATARDAQTQEPVTQADVVPVKKNTPHAQHAVPTQVAQTPANQPQPVAHVPAPAPQKPVAQNSPVGIGVGAVIGGVIGNQMGSGDGKTLATIAGAIGGGYLGNEVAKNAKP